MKSQLILLAFIGTVVAATAQAQSNPSFTTAPEAASAGGNATDEQAELAKKTQNPVATLVSVPIQNNWDFGIGPANAMKYTANLQPVVPFMLIRNGNWSSAP